MPKPRNADRQPKPVTYAARVLIADCTGRNANVFYEIGIAHTIGKPVVLVTQSSAGVPFDLRHLRDIQYEYTPRGMASFEKILQKTFARRWRFSVTAPDDEGG